MATKRRMGTENAATRSLLMDAVEAVMREQGYAALSARSVAARAGLKYQIVFYYFATMDDLLLATYRRRTESVLLRTEEALVSDRPLHALWQASSDPFDASLSLEYMAMSNHNAVIRAETIAFGERVREVVAERLRGRLEAASPDRDTFTPIGVAVSVFLMGGIFGFEQALGLSGGHREVEAIVAWGLRQFEPEGAPAEAG
jgi:AcrR family transcriptional regulator